MKRNVKVLTVIVIIASLSMGTRAQIKVANNKIGIGCDPDGGSYTLKLGGPVRMNNQALNYVHQVHFNDNVRFYDENNDSYLNFKYGDSGAGGIKFYDGNGTRQGYIYCDGNSTPAFGMLDGDGSWAVRIKKDTDTRFYVNGSQKMIIKSNGCVGIGKDPHYEYKLDIAGVVNATAHLTESDGRFKRDIKNYNGTSSDFYKLRPVTYKFKNFPNITDYTVEDTVRNDSLLAFGLPSTGLAKKRIAKTVEYDSRFKAKYNREREEIGYIAQEIRELYPDLVYENESGFLSVNYTGLIPIMQNAMREQQIEIEDQKKLNENQQQEIEQQKLLLQKQQAEIELLKKQMRQLLKQ